MIILCIEPLFIHPWLLVLKYHFPLSISDQVIRESSALHNVVSFVGLPGHCQLDVPLEVALGMAHDTLNTTNTTTCPAP